MRQGRKVRWKKTEAPWLTRKAPPVSQAAEMPPQFSRKSHLLISQLLPCYLSSAGFSSSSFHINLIPALGWGWGMNPPGGQGNGTCQAQKIKSPFHLA